MKSTLLSFHFLSASCLSLGLCTSALAQTPPAPDSKPPVAKEGRPHGHHPAMQKLDKDGNKMISREEAKGHPRLEKDFDAIDTNKDGQLSQDEMRAHAQKMRGERKGEHKGGPIARLDANKDGKLSREEAKGHPMLEKNFERIDTNKDGLLSEDELKAARKSEMDARHKRESGAK